MISRNFVSALCVAAAQEGKAGDRTPLLRNFLAQSLGNYVMQTMKNFLNVIDSERWHLLAFLR